MSLTHKQHNTVLFCDHLKMSRCNLNRYFTKVSLSMQVYPLLFIVFKIYVSLGNKGWIIVSGKLIQNCSAA